MNPLTPFPAFPSTIDELPPRDLEGACRALEREFVTLVFREMREAMMPKASKGSSGFARQTTESMLDAQWAELASQGEGLGLWRALYRQLDPGGVKSPSGAADQMGEDGGLAKRSERKGVER